MHFVVNQVRAEKTIADQYADKAAVRSQQKSQLVSQTGVIRIKARVIPSLHHQRLGNLVVFTLVISYRCYL